MYAPSDDEEVTWTGRADGCICYDDGTCHERYLDKSWECENGEGVVYFVEQRDCIIVNTTTLSKTPSEEQPQQAGDFFIADQCGVKSDPAATLCTQQLEPGCACYKNGTCEYLPNANRCTACLEADILSYNKGEQCPELEDNTKLFACEPRGEPLACLEYITQGCVCYQNGTCTEGLVNACSDCGREGVVSVLEGGSCAVTQTLSQQEEETQEEEPEEPTEPETNFFIPDQCTFPKSDPAATLCTQQLEPGCACYKNGTCEYLPNANRCTACLEADILSYNKGEHCPELEDNTKLFACEPRGEPLACLEYITQGCVCYQNGTCTEGLVNACSDCGREGVVSVLEGGSCAVTQTLSQQEEETQEESVEEPQQAGDFFVPNQCAYPKSRPCCHFLP